MKNRILTLLLLTGICASSFAQIRDYIYVVRPAYDAKVLSIFESTADAMEKNGIKDAAEYVRKSKDGGFGSGFLITASNGRNYVVTNRHVVVDASEATLEIESADGATTKISGAKVIAVDDEVDLALIELPEGTPVRKGLQFAPAKAKDGDDVLSAGYPGLGNKPSWQLGKGSITNASARVGELVDTERTTLIQHSAQVDPGNSGGPLLIPNAAGREGYYVLGVNTWKASSRQAANFAIPAAAVQAFVERVISSQGVDKASAALAVRGKDFSVTSAIDNEDDPMERSRRIARYVSLDYVSSYGTKALLNAYSSAPTVAIREIMGTLVDLSPIEGMRLAIAYEIDGKLRDGDTLLTLAAPTAPTVTSGGKEGTMSFGSDKLGPVETKWVMEAANWRLDWFMKQYQAEEKTDSKGTSKVTLEPPYYGMLYAAVNLQETPGTTFVGGMEGNGHYFGLGMEVGGGLINIEADPADPYSEDSSALLVKMAGFLRLQFPVSMDPVSFVPYVDLSGGMQISVGSFDGYNGLYSSYGAGLNLCFGGDLVTIVGIEVGREGSSGMFDASGAYDVTYVTLSVGFGAK